MKAGQIRPRFSQQYRLQRVIIANDLVVSGQYRSGMPEAYINEALILDANSRYVNAADGYMRRVIHHGVTSFHGIQPLRDVY